MILRALQSFASCFCILTCSTAASAQGTIQFGFEEFQVKDVPPFVTGQATVEDSTSSILVTPAFEGQKFLFGYGTISIASPDGQPIQSFSMRILVPRHSVPPNDYLIVVRNAVTATRLGAPDWQPLQATLSSPAQALEISVFWSFETIPAYFGIDGVQFTTVPEPQTYWLLTLGLGAILLRRSKSLKTQSG